MDLLQYIGHYHPVILHLPIGFLLLAFVMQVLDWRSKKAAYTAAIHLGLLLGMVSAILAGLTGYWLSQEGGYEETLLDKHKWLGIGVGVLSVVVWLTFKTKSKLYTPSFILLLFVLLGAGHFGGSLTHGSNFLSYQDQQASTNTASLENAILFTDVIKKDLFQDSLEVALEMNFKNINIFYTTDGSIPDTNSIVYTEPFTIFKTSKINAIAHKAGWQTSTVAERQFVQAKYTPVDIQLDKAPNDRYKADGATSLIDFQKGSTTFTDGNWLGYENSHFTATLDLGATQMINGITVSALEATGSYIFFPKGLDMPWSNYSLGGGLTDVQPPSTIMLCPVI